MRYLIAIIAIVFFLGLPQGLFIQFSDNSSWSIESRAYAQDDDEEEEDEDDDEFDDFEFADDDGEEEEDEDDGEEDEEDEEVADEDEDEDEEESEDVAEDEGDEEDDFEEFADEDGEEDSEDPFLSDLDEEEDVSDELEELEPLEEDADSDTAFEEPSEEPDSVLETPDPAFADADPALNEPDLELEAKLYNIYVNFHSAPTPQDQWSLIIGDRESVVYKIQRGDTLWDISETFFSDGNYWPKVWSLNSRIENPHLISTGNSINFILGDEEDAPAFTITESEQEPENQQTLQQATEDVQEFESEEVDFEEEVEEETPVAESAEDQEVAPKQSLAPVQGAEAGPEAPEFGEELADIEIPPPSVVGRPVLTKLPPSIPEWQSDGFGDGYDSTGFKAIERVVINRKVTSILTNFVVDEFPQTIGKIMEVESGGLAGSDFQYVYIKIPKGVGAPQMKVVAIANGGPVEKPNRYIDDERDLGIIVEVQGELTLMEVVGSKDPDDEFDLYRAVVTRAAFPIAVGSEVVKGRFPRVKYTMKGPRSNAVSQLVGGHLGNSRRLLGRLSFVYLNRGSRDGFQVGQILPIRANRQVRNAESLIDENIRPIGYIRVVRVSDSVSTGVIVKAFEDIRVGDLTGQGQLMAGQSIEPQNKGGDLPDADLDELDEEDFGDEELDEDFFE